MIRSGRRWGHVLFTVMAALSSVVATSVLLPPSAQAQLSSFAHSAANDFDTLDAAGNNAPSGIWSDGTTMWVADWNDPRLYAYRMSDRSRDPGRDFKTLDVARNEAPSGIWSDGTTMWVADWEDGRLYAYRMSDRSRDPGRGFDTRAAGGNDNRQGISSGGTTVWVAKGVDDTLSDAVNDNPQGIWSDGTTMWVADWEDNKLYAYRMSDRSRDPARDFDTLDATGNDDPRSIWSDGTTMWVADWNDRKLYAYRMSDRSRDPARDFDTLDATGNDDPRGIWSDGTTMWVTDDHDDKLYAYSMPIELSALAVTDPGGNEISLTPAFTSGTLSYTATVANGVDEVTVSATAADENAEAAYLGTDADTGANGHQVALEEGWNTIEVKEANSSLTYTVRVCRASVNSSAHNPCADFDTLYTAGNRHPLGIWSDGTTIWVADDRGTKLYAYRMSDRSRDRDRDFDTLDAAGNDDSTGIWSDGAAMWVADDRDDKLYAYNIRH